MNPSSNEGIEKLNRYNTVEQVTEALREYILTGKLAPGQRLQQKELAASLGVSRMPVREALRQLEVEGLVVLNPHRGAAVSVLSESELREIYDMRIALEKMAVGLSITFMNETHFERLDGILAEMEVTEDRQHWLDLNLHFHQSISIPCGRAILWEVISNLRRRSERYLRAMTTQPERVQEANQEHRDILQACRARDVIQAEELLGQHLKHTVNSLEFSREVHSGEASVPGTD